MIKNIVSAVIVMLCLFSSAYAGQLADPNATVSTMRTISVTPAANALYAIASVEYPASWGNDITFTVEVNGRPVRIRKVSGGFSGATSTADLMFFPKKAGRQNITVKTVVNGKNMQSKSSFDWKQTPFVAVMEHEGDREIMMEKDKSLVVAAANVMDVRISFNGKDMHGRLSGSGDIQIRSLDPAWRQGKNVLTVSGNKFDGSLIAKNFTFLYLGEDGVLPLGETAILYYGKEGSKSGPFYDVKVNGDALTPVRDVRTDHLSMDKEGWLISDPMLGKELRAQKPGTATIQIFIKPHFLEKMKLDRELTITIAQP